MATKDEAFAYVRQIGVEGTLTRDELNDAYNEGSKTPVPVHEDSGIKKLGFAGVFNYIGGGIVLLGIIILIAQNWDKLSFVTQLLVTLGAAVAFYIIGVVYGRIEKLKTASTVFHFLGAVLMPFGICFVLDHYGVDFWNFGGSTLIALGLFVMYLVSDLIFKKNVLTFFSIAFGTWFFFALVNYLLGSSMYADVWEFYQYCMFGAGLTHVLLGYAFSNTRRVVLTNVLYAFGLLFALSAGFALSGFDAELFSIWNFIYPIVLVAVLYLSVVLKSRPFLVFGTIYLMAFIIKITAEFFSDSLGWPLALVIAGLLVIGAGSFSMHLRKKYFMKG